jgi:hypothetical protein
LPNATVGLPPDPAAATKREVPPRQRPTWLGLTRFTTARFTSAKLATSGLTTARLATARLTLTEGLPFVKSRVAPSGGLSGALGVEDRNASRLYADLLWTSVFSAAAAFNGAFAVRLGASNELVGLLNSLPFLVVALLTLPFSRVVERSANRVRLVARAVLAHRLGFFLVALVPLLFPIGRAEAFIAVVVLMTIPASLVNITFHCLFADVVPETRRATVISVRMIIASGVVMALTPLFGRWLDTARFPENYQTIYVVGFLASLLAVRALARIEAPAPPAQERAAESASSRTPRERLVGSWRLIADEKPFARILVNTVVHVIGNWIANPLYVIYYVRVLGASDGWIGMLTSVASLSAMIGYELWRRIIARRGETLSLRVTVVLAGLYPLGIALTHDLGTLLLLACLNGLVQPGLNTSHYAVLLRTCPATRRPAYMAIFTTVMNAGAFVGPMVGVALAAVVGINGAIGFGATLWLIGGALFWVFPVQPAGRGRT